MVETRRIAYSEEPLPFPSLHRYLALPPQQQLDFIVGLNHFAQYIPRNTDLRTKDEAAIEASYQEVADNFAGFVDKSYTPGKPDNKPETIVLRDTFFQMIRPLSQEQLVCGIEALHAHRRHFS